MSPPSLKCLLSQIPSVSGDMTSSDTADSSRTLSDREEKELAPDGRWDEHGCIARYLEGEGINWGRRRRGGRSIQWYSLCNECSWMNYTLCCLCETSFLLCTSWHIKKPSNTQTSRYIHSKDRSSPFCRETSNQWPTVDRDCSGIPWRFDKWDPYSFQNHRGILWFEQYPTGSCACWTLDLSPEKGSTHVKKGKRCAIIKVSVIMSTQE